MTIFDKISQAKYGKNYKQLPDDGVEQDFVQGEYSRQNQTPATAPAAKYFTLFTRKAWRTGAAPIGNFETRAQAEAKAREIIRANPTSDGLSEACHLATGFEIVGYFEPDPAAKTDKATATHSPLPWTQGGNGIECAGQYRVGSVNSIGTREGMANMDLIIQAVNEHAALVAVVEARQKNMDEHDQRAKMANFAYCGCEDCKASRPLLANLAAVQGGAK